jgi:uncharacterized protein YegP (UPF0339 family)
MKLEIYKVRTGEYSWRLKSKGREIARMPDGTASPSKIKRTIKALRGHASAPMSQLGRDSEISNACAVALGEFEKLHPSRKAILS